MLLGNPEVAHLHFLQCLRLNPAHNKARRALYKPAHYREVESNVFEMIELKSPAKVLLILFGDLGDVVSAFPVVPALKKKFNCEMAWLTSPEYAALARSSFSGDVHEAKSRGIIPWDWIHEQGFTHVFFPEPGANYEEWEQSGLHATDFIARKCQVQIESRRPQIEPTAEATAAAKKFLRDHGLRRSAFITATHGDSEGRHWPKSNLVKLAQQSRIPVVVFGKKGDPAIPCTVGCRDKPPEVVALLIRWSCFYLGSACGTSWLATTTDTPIGVFFDPQERNDQNRGCLEMRAGGKKQNIQEWSIYTNLRTVQDHIESAVCLRQ